MNRSLWLSLGILWSVGCGGSTADDDVTPRKDSGVADSVAVDGADSTAADSAAGDSAAADSTAADSSAADSTAADSTATDGAADSTAADTTATDAGADAADGGGSAFCATSGVAATQVFGATMVGCAGKVSYASRAALCGAGYVVCGAKWWTGLRKGKNPTYNYWVDEPLKYSGSATACSVSTATGTSCTTDSPMRVCSGISDPLGNTCTWERCGLESTTNEYFGGCSGTADKAAGTLCCAPPCASGAPSQVFGAGMFGCAGKVTFDKNKTLCGAGHHVCSATEWTSKRAGGTPTHHYWTADNLRYSGTGTGSCSVSTSTGSVCDGGANPMRVCAGTTATAADPEGNVCNWTGCGLGATTPNEYFGGCAGNTTAGSLCCAD